MTNETPKPKPSLPRSTSTPWPRPELFGQWDEEDSPWPVEPSEEPPEVRFGPQGE